LASSERGFIGGGIVGLELRPLQDLPDKRRLADLARTGDDLDEPAGLGQPLLQNVRMGASEQRGVPIYSRR